MWPAGRGGGIVSGDFDRARQAIEAAHDADPAGQERAYGESVLAWVLRLRPEAEGLLRLCALAQHLERWVIPRDSRPMDRAGYHAWRTAVAHRQGERLQEILLAAGYPAAEAERAGRLVAKRIPRSDADAQVLEDGACLVFLDEQVDEFASKQADKMISIIRKTWVKMSPAAQDLARQLPLSPEAATLVKAALA
jgi:tRNAThr (cytosine32-N3)-methyltransferase